eukprot:scaffold9600_cov132-Isochrysis_galbana.AAC.6
MAPTRLGGGVGLGSKGKYTRGGGGGRGGRSKSGGYIGARGMCDGCTGMTMGWSDGVRSGLCQQSKGLRGGISPHLQ